MHRIALLYGGTSSEREVSLKSGKAVAAALEAIGHAVTCYDLTQDSIAAIAIERHTLAFIAMHGGWGEDGGLQAELECAGLRYTGSDPIACRLGMDKELTKACFLHSRIPTAPYEVVTRTNASRVLERFARRLGWPLVIKPACQGSSVGVSMIRALDEGEKALAAAFSYDERVLIEQAVIGKEITVPIIGARAYPPVGVMPAGEFFDYHSKYKAKETRYTKTPDLTPVQVKAARYYAKRAHDALGCHAYSRVDMIVADNGDMCVLEVNTAPGMTERSLLPLSTSAAGLTYEETVQAMIDASLAPRKGARRVGDSQRASANSGVIRAG